MFVEKTFSVFMLTVVRYNFFSVQSLLSWISMDMYYF